MTLIRLIDLSAARWLADDRSDWGRLVTLGPAGFDAYARLRFIPDPTRDGMAENDVDRAEESPSDLEQCRIVLTSLDDAGTECIYAVWEGWPSSYLDPALLDGPLLDLRHRRYVLFAGQLGEILDWEAQFGGIHSPPPAFAWPADRRWCFTSDVDPHWAGIGGPATMIDSLIARTDLDIVAASLDVRPPHYTN